MADNSQVPGSFRDPSGVVFVRDGLHFRQVNVSYRADYDRLMGSGLYQHLVSSGLLIPHDEVSTNHAISDNAYKVLSPQAVSYTHLTLPTNREV